MMTNEAINKAAEVRDSISSAVNAYEGAVSRRSGISTAKERVMNLMFTHRSLILEALGEVGKMANRIEMLASALQDADEENDELRRNLREMTEAKPENPAPKKRKSKASAESKILTAVVEEDGGERHGLSENGNPQ